MMTNDINPRWREQAYPLKQITIRLQGTRHSDVPHIVAQLDKIRDRLLQGDITGTDHDDDFGYAFSVAESPDGPSFFDDPSSGSKTVKLLKLYMPEPGRGVTYDASPDRVREFSAEESHRSEIRDMTDEQIVMELGREAFRRIYGDNAC